MISYFLQLFPGKGTGKDVFCCRLLIKEFTQRIDDHTVAVVTDLISVFTYPVYAYHITLVFYGARLQQRFPGPAAPLGN